MDEELSFFHLTVYVLIKNTNKLSESIFIYTYIQTCYTLDIDTYIITYELYLYMHAYVIYLYIHNYIHAYTLYLYT